MSYTYSGNPNSSIIDETHYRLGNTDPSNPIATDEECWLALKDNHNNTYLAAASILETKALQFAWGPMGRRQGRAPTRYDPADAFRIAAATLRMQASLKTCTVYAGGLSTSEHEGDARASDLVQPFVGKNLHLRPTPVSPAIVVGPDLSREE